MIGLFNFFKSSISEKLAFTFRLPPMYALIGDVVFLISPSRTSDEAVTTKSVSESSVTVKSSNFKCLNFLSKEDQKFILWLITFEPLILEQSYIPASLRKLLKSGG